MAAALDYMVEEPPVNGVIELAGPESLPIAEFVGRYARATDFVRGPSSRRWCQPRRAHSPHSGPAHGRRPPRTPRTLVSSPGRVTRRQPGPPGDGPRADQRPDPAAEYDARRARRDVRPEHSVRGHDVGRLPAGGGGGEPAPRACHLLRYAGGARAPGWCLSHDWVGWAIPLNGRPGPSLRQVER